MSVWPQTLTSFSLSFPVCQVRIIVAPTCRGCEEPMGHLGSVSVTPKEYISANTVTSVRWGKDLRGGEGPVW